MIECIEQIIVSKLLDSISLCNKKLPHELTVLIRVPRDYYRLFHLKNEWKYWTAECIQIAWFNSIMKSQLTTRMIVSIKVPRDYYRPFHLRYDWMYWTAECIQIAWFNSIIQSQLTTWIYSSNNSPTRLLSSISS